MRHASKTCLFLFISACIFSACGNKEDKAKQTIRTVSIDNQVNDAEFTAVLAAVRAAGAVHIVDSGNSYTLKTDDDIALFFINKGISGPAKQIAALITHRAPLEHLYVMLDNSDSMQGYFKSGTSDMTRPVIAIYNGVEPNVNIETAYVGEKNHETNFSTVEKKKFDSDLANGKVLVGTSSPLDQIFKLAVEKVAGTEAISCVITDGILSGTNQEIANNREFTVLNLPLLEQRIREIFTKNTGVDFLVYRFEGAFSGTYYDYSNKRHTLTNVQRPFFLFCFGEADYLTDFAKRVEDEPNFKFTDRLASYEIGGYDTLTKGQLLGAQNVEKINIVPAQNSVILPTSPLHTPANFRLKIGVRDLPAFVNDEQYLTHALTFKYKDPSGIMLPVDDFLQGLSVDNKTLGTYIMDLQISPELASKFGQNMTIQIRLGGLLDEWYLQKSCSEDKVSGGNDQLTFGLDALLRAMLMGKNIMPNNLKDAIDIPISIVKK